MVNDWLPDKYLRFAAERAQPARDLIARLLHFQPKAICDLGCGPGNSTAMLREAFPNANITGFDSSPAMIAKAQQAFASATFIEADISVWQAPDDVDIIFSNALFQWVPGHEQVLLRILKSMKPGAVLAIQMPDNLGEPSHRLMGEVAHALPFADKQSAAGNARSELLSVAQYHDLFSPYTDHLDIWRTTYHHALNGLQGIVDMLSTTGLKPFLDPLSPDELQKFLDHYKEAIAPHYSQTSGGKVLYPFPRLFMVAVSAGK